MRGQGPWFTAGVGSLVNGEAGLDGLATDRADVELRGAGGAGAEVSAGQQQRVLDAVPANSARHAQRHLLFLHLGDARSISHTSHAHYSWRGPGVALGALQNPQGAARRGRGTVGVCARARDQRIDQPIGRPTDRQAAKRGFGFDG